MSTYTKTVLLSMVTGSTVAGRFEVWEEDPEDEDLVRLSLQFKGHEITRSSDNLFFALNEIRLALQSLGAIPHCYGASKEVYASPMILSMGAGENAYKLRLGIPAKTEDLVNIFDSGPGMTPVDVEEQEQFYALWLQSLQSKSNNIK
jgi:hypothetical protein